MDSVYIFWTIYKWCRYLRYLLCFSHLLHINVFNRPPGPVLVDLTLEPEASPAADMLHMMAQHSDAGQVG